MIRDMMLRRLKSCEQYFDRSTECLTEEHSSFKPRQETMTAAQQVAHVAQTVDWFREGAFSADGFDLDFEKHTAQVAKVTSLADAREWLASAFARLREAVETHSEEAWREPIAEGPVMGGLPRFWIVGSLEDHTAHHRGALTVYSRLNGLTPAMPYM